MPSQAPPVRSSAVQRQDQQVNRAEANLTTITETLRANNAAQAKAILAMFNGDKALRDRFLAVTFRLLAQDSKILRDATPISVVDAVMTAASMGLEPLTSDGAIIVYGSTATFRPMYRGYLKRIRNSGKVQEIDTQVVYENDEFELGLGTDPFIRHIPARSTRDAEGKINADRGNYRGAYAWALMPSGKTLIEWMEEADINYVRDTFSQAQRSDSPWRTSWGEMARKTVLNRLSKRLPSAAVEALLVADHIADRMEREPLGDEQKDELRRIATEAALQLVPGAVTNAPDEPPADPPAVPTGDTEQTGDADKEEEAAPVDGGLFNDT